MSREVVYGRNPVREALAAGRRRVHEVWALPDLGREPWLAGVNVLPRQKADLARAAGTGDHQGVVAFCDPYPYAEEWEVAERPGPVVCLDGAQDPRNLGAVARVAEGAGAAGIVITRRGSPGVTPVVCKASAGAVEHLAVARVENLSAYLHDARGTDRWAVGADADEGEDYRSVDWDAGTILVLGSEGAGLRPRVKASCDRLVRIPMAGRTASLNLAVAAGVLLFEIKRSTDR